MQLIYPIAVSILLVSLHVSSSGAADTLNIKDLKFSVGSYQLKTVTIHGAVKDLKALPPHFSGGSGRRSCIVYGSYTFTLVDESGELDVQKAGRCFDVQNKPPVNEGDVVIVQGVVQFFHPGASGAQVPTVRIEAQEVVKIGL
jgi:DNA/RNA endonuclease YhcR with UshA esterase domain